MYVRIDSTSTYQRSSNYTKQPKVLIPVDPIWPGPRAPGEQTCDLHRQRLFCGVAHWGQQAWPAQPEHHSAAQKHVWGCNEEHFAMDI